MKPKTTPKEIVIKNFRINPSDIVFIKAILESYEGMVVVRTVEVGQPIIEILIAHDFVDTINQVVKDLQKQVLMREVPAPSVLPPSWP